MVICYPSAAGPVQTSESSPVAPTQDPTNERGHGTAGEGGRRNELILGIGERSGRGERGIGREGTWG